MIAALPTNLSAEINRRPPWSSFKKMAFRFCTICFIIYVFPFPLNPLPFLHLGWYSQIWDGYTNAINHFVAWVNHVFHIYPYPLTIFANGSGDTSSDYLLYALYIVISILGALAWTLLDRKRESYYTAYRWVRIAMRYFVCYVLFTYGWIKVFHLQMPAPGLVTLATPLGEHSPMGLAWTYLGYSKGFSALAGWIEVTGGVLLLFRRTVVIGALLDVIIFSNIFLINLFFDVPVKLFSAAMLLMSLFLLLSDRRRLANVFWHNKRADPSFESRPLLGKRWHDTTGQVLKWIFFIALSCSMILDALKSQQQYGDEMPIPKLYGIYIIHSITHNHDSIPLLVGDSLHWKQLIIDKWNYAQVKYLNDGTREMARSEDTIRHTLTTYDWNDSANTSQTYQYIMRPGQLVLQSATPTDTLRMSFAKFDEHKFILTHTPFRWINEYPFNR